MSRRRSAGAAGFTLVELVVVIVLAAIVASFIVLFLDAPIESYFAQTRRSDLVDSANRITDAVTADVRAALPNSLRIRTVGTRMGLEMLATEGVARYYGEGDKNNVAGEELTIGPGHPATSFGTLDSFIPTPPPSPPSPYLSVGNLGTPASPPLGTFASAPYDAYARGNGVITGATTQIIVGSNPNPAPPPPFVPGEAQVTLTGTQMTFQAPGAPATQPSVHNAYLVSGPVSYVCDSRAGTLTRYSGYAIAAAQAVPPAGTSAPIAQDVSGCTMSIVSAPAGYAYGELAILTVTLANSGETLQVFLEAPAEYAQ
jgi:MSHA biogenesis protein MshO